MSGLWERLQAALAPGPGLDAYLPQRALALAELSAAMEDLQDLARAADYEGVDTPEMTALLSAAAVLVRAIALELRSRRRYRELQLGAGASDDTA